MKRLLMYSQDGMGLGHLRRSSNIAQEILTREPDCDILILADSPATSLIASQRGIDVLKLPTIVKTGSASWKSTSWRNGTLSSKVQRIVNLRAKLILQTFLDFRPDAVLVDHMPVGALGELRPMLGAAIEGARRTKLFLGLRDILDSPAVIRRVWREVGGYDYLPHYDGVLIYGRRDIYDATTAYRLRPHARNIVYCNYVSRLTTIRSAPTTDPFLLMMGGGGHDAFPVAEAFLDAAPELCRKLHMGALVVTGPNMESEQRDALVAKSTPMARVETCMEEPELLIQKAAAVVTLGGYNSLCEVLLARKKALVVPRAGPSAEQRTRSQAFSERGLIRVLDSSDATPERLTQELLHLVDDDDLPNESRVPPLDGAQRSAGVLLDGVPAAQEEVPDTFSAGIA